MKLEAGKKMPDFEYLDLEGNKCKYYDLLTNPKNAIVFLRYYGCTVCQLSIIELRERFSEFKEANMGLSVVLQSDPQKLKEELGDTRFEFNLILDPDQKVYELLEIGSASSKEELGGGNTVERITKAKALGLEHGRYEGNEMQLPATFILDQNGEVIKAKYGKFATDTMTVDEILAINK